MNKINLYKKLIFIILLAVVSGCSPLQKDFHSKNYFSLQINIKDLETKNLESNRLLVRQLSISPEFDTSFFVYDLGSGEYQKDYYNQFLVPPSRMITNILEENLYSSGLFCPVLETGSSDIYYRLWGKIVNLYVDIKNPDHPSCVLSIRLILDKKNLKNSITHKRDNAQFISVLSKYYEVCIPLSDNTPKLITLAWSKALQSIFYKFYEDITDEDYHHIKLICN